MQCAFHVDIDEQQIYGWIVAHFRNCIWKTARHISVASPDLERGRDRKIRTEHTGLELDSITWLQLLCVRPKWCARVRHGELLGAGVALRRKNAVLHPG